MRAEYHFASVHVFLDHFFVPERPGRTGRHAGRFRAIGDTLHAEVTLCHCERSEFHAATECPERARQHAASAACTAGRVSAHRAVVLLDHRIVRAPGDARWFLAMATDDRERSRVFHVGALKRERPVIDPLAGNRMGLAANA